MRRVAGARAIRAADRKQDFLRLVKESMSRDWVEKDKLLGEKYCIPCYGLKFGQLGATFSIRVPRQPVGI